MSARKRAALAAARWWCEGNKIVRLRGATHFSPLSSNAQSDLSYIDVGALIRDRSDVEQPTLRGVAPLSATPERNPRLSRPGFLQDAVSASLKPAPLPWDRRVAHGVTPRLS